MGCSGSSWGCLLLGGLAILTSTLAFALALAVLARTPGLRKLSILVCKVSRHSSTLVTWMLLLIVQYYLTLLRRPVFPLLLQRPVESLNYGISFALYL